MTLLNDLVQTLVRPEIKALSAYHVPEQRHMIKLDAMENPYPLPEHLRQQWLAVLSAVQINRYPHPGSPGVKAALRKFVELKPEYELILGNGSDELIQMIAMTVAKPGAVLLSAEPSFVMYKMIAQFAGMQYQGAALTDDFALDKDAMLTAIATHNPAVIFLSQPNNPTGNVFDPRVVKAIIEAAPGLVVIDEAYVAFTDADALSWLDVYPNVLVLRTLSKIGLAGLRLGFLAGRPEWLSEIEKLRLPYNINVLTQASVEFALAHYDAFREQTELIRNERARMTEQLQSLTLEKVWPSEANFVLVRTAAGEARTVFDSLKKQNVLIKCLDGTHPLLKDCLRLTIGTPAENQTLLEAMEKALLD